MASSSSRLLSSRIRCAPKQLAFASMGVLAFVRAVVACSSSDGTGAPSTPVVTPEAGTETGPTTPFDSGPITQQDTSVPPQCDVTKDYGTLDVLTSTREIFSASLTNSEGLLYVTAECVGTCSTGTDVYTTIVKTANTLDSFLAVTGASTAGIDSNATLTDDAKTMIIATSTSTDASSMKHLARYVDKGSGFTLDVDTIGADPNPADDVQPFILPDQTLYFASNRLVRNDTYQVFRAAHNATGGYDTPVKIDAINVGGTDQQNPVASGDESVVYFSSPRDGTLGGQDIWRVTKAAGAADYAAAEHMTALSSPKSDAVTWMSPDTCHIYVISDREGSMKLYKASKPK